MRSGNERFNHNHQQKEAATDERRLLLKGGSLVALLRRKESPMKANMKRLAVLVVLVGIALFVTRALATAGPGKQTLEGVWQAELTILSACGPTGVPVAQFPGLLTYTSDGKVIETPATPLAANPAIVRTSPGLGSWQHEGGQQFSNVFRFFQITVPGSLPAGSGTIKQAIELSQDGDSYTVTGTGDFFDSNGNLTAHTCHTETATRLE
jgi:hypothetical protein